MRGTVNMVNLVGRVGSIETRGKTLVVKVATVSWNGETLWHVCKFLSASLILRAKVLATGQSVWLRGSLSYELLTGRDGKQTPRVAVVIVSELEVVSWPKAKEGEV